MLDANKNTRKYLKISETVIIKLGLIAISILFGIVIVGCLILPEIFYDNFVWKYFWGSIVADAKEQSFGEINEGYNIINTLTYGILLIFSLLGIYKLLKKLKVTFDTKLIGAIIPFIVLGSVLRALEDAQLFREPIVYLFIAPIIYIFIGLLTLALLVISTYISRFAMAKNQDRSLFFYGLTYIFFNVSYCLMYFFTQNLVSYAINPIIFGLVSIIKFSVVTYLVKLKKVQNSYIFLSGYGLILLIPTLLTLVQWPHIASWASAYKQASGTEAISPRPLTLTFIIGFTIIATLCVYAISKYLSFKHKNLKIFLNKINVTLIFSQLLDASATFIGIDYYGYWEKHVLPSFLIDTFHTAAVMLIIKILIVTLAIYLIDIEFKKDLERNPLLVSLIKICIIVLGMAPGIRDMLRLAMGV